MAEGEPLWACMNLFMGDKRFFGRHPDVVRSTAGMDLLAIRFAARQMRRRKASSWKSMLSANTNGDDSRKRVMSSSRL
jgi:hypothetical protein